MQSLTRREQEHIVKYIQDGIAAGRNLSSLSDELAKQFSRRPGTIRNLFYKMSNQRINLPISLGRKPYATRLPTEIWYLLDAMNEVTQLDKTVIVTKALEEYTNTLDDEVYERVIQRQREMMQGES